MENRKVEMGTKHLIIFMFAVDVVDTKAQNESARMGVQVFVRRLFAFA